MIRLRRILLWLFISGAIVLLAGVIFCIVEDRSGRRAWGEYKTAALQRGLKLDLADFIPPEVPDEQNFAAIPIFQDAFKASAAGETPVDHFKISAEISEGIKPGDKALTLDEWHRRFVKAGFISQPTSDQFGDLRLALDRYEPALAQFREAAHRSHSRFGNDWLRWRELRNPHFTLLQPAMVVLSVRMRVNLAAGDSSAAYADWQLGQRLVRSIEREPTMISGLVRTALRQLLVESMKQGLAGRGWSEAELRALAADLDAVRVFEDYSFAIQSERGFCNLVIPELTAEDQPFQELGAHACGIPFVFKEIANRFYPEGWGRRSQVWLNELCDALLERVDVNLGKVVSPSPSVAMFDETYLEASLLDRMRLHLAYASMPMLCKLENRFVGHHALIQQALLACALERHRFAHDEYPPTLGELIPTFLPAVPVDPWDGKPFRYQRTESGYRLWAIGEDRKDDGGIFDPKNPRKQQDAIWQIP